VCSRALCQILLSLLGQLVKEKGRMAPGEDRNRKEPEREVSSDETVSLGRDEAEAFVSRPCPYPESVQVFLIYSVTLTSANI